MDTQSSTTSGSSIDGSEDLGNEHNQPSISARISAYHALRDRLAPQITHREVLEDYLRSNHWNVNRAYDQYVAHTERLRAEQASPASSSSHSSSEERTSSDSFESREQADSSSDLEETEGHEMKDVTSEEEELIGSLRNRNLPFNNNTEQERRDAALAFREHILEIYGSRLSITEAVLLLHLAHWDIGEAAAQFVTHDEALSRLHNEFDRHRRPLQIPIAKQSSPDQEAQDERLAMLISITARPDWWSLLLFLRSHDFDLVQAVYVWFRKGIEPEQHKNDNKGFGRRVDISRKPLPMPSKKSTKPGAHGNEKGWSSERKAFKDDPAPEQIVDRPKTKRAIGSIINDSRRPVKMHQEDSKKFLIEYISKGRYWSNRFCPKGFVFKDLVDAKADKEKLSQKALEFNFGIQGHVDALNNWRRQNFTRITGQQVRDAAQHWSPAELQYLFDLYNNHLEVVKTGKPDVDEVDILPLVLSDAIKRDWEKKFNVQFAGTIQPGSANPRLPRKIGAMITMAKRWQPIVDKFKVKPDDSWFEKQRKRKRKDSPEAEPVGGEEFEAVEDTSSMFSGRMNKRDDRQHSLPAEEQCEHAPSPADVLVKEEEITNEEEPDSEDENPAQLFKPGENPFAD